MYVRTDGWMDGGRERGREGPTDGRTEGWMDGLGLCICVRTYRYAHA